MAYGCGGHFIFVIVVYTASKSRWRMIDVLPHIKWGLVLLDCSIYLHIQIFPWLGRQLRRLGFDSVVKYNKCICEQFRNNIHVVSASLPPPPILVFIVPHWMLPNNRWNDSSEFDKTCPRQLMTDIRDIIWEKLIIRLKAWLRIRFGHYPKVNL